MAVRATIAANKNRRKKLLVMMDSPVQLEQLQKLARNKLRVKATHFFLEGGVELEDGMCVSQDQLVLCSFGEDYIGTTATSKAGYAEPSEESSAETVFMLPAASQGRICGSISSSDQCNFTEGGVELKDGMCVSQDQLVLCSLGEDYIGTTDAPKAGYAKPSEELSAETVSMLPAASPCQICSCISRSCQSNFTGASPASGWLAVGCGWITAGRSADHETLLKAKMEGVSLVVTLLNIDADESKSIQWASEDLGLTWHHAPLDHIHEDIALGSSSERRVRVPTAQAWKSFKSIVRVLDSLEKAGEVVLLHGTSSNSGLYLYLLLRLAGLSVQDTVDELVQLPMVENRCHEHQGCRLVNSAAAQPDAPKVWCKWGEHIFDALFLHRLKTRGAMLWRQALSTARLGMVLDADGFQEWLGDCAVSEITHLKTLTEGLECWSVQAEAEVFAKLSQCSVLVWDGGPYNIAGSTRIIPRFLSTGRRVAAFCAWYNLCDFKGEWAFVIEKFPDDVAVVVVDIDDEDLTVTSLIGSQPGVAFNVSCSSCAEAQTSMVLSSDAAAKEARQWALGDISEEPELFRAVCARSSEFMPLPMLHLREGFRQTFEAHRQYVLRELSVPTWSCNTLLFVLLGHSFDTLNQALFLPHVEAYCAAFFSGFHIETLPTTIDLGKRTECSAKNLLRILKEEIAPSNKHAYCTIGLTFEDLRGDINGLTQFDGYVSCMSFATLSPKWDTVLAKDARERLTGTQKAQWIFWSLRVLTHEMCHMLGMRHCRQYACLMNAGDACLTGDDMGNSMFLCPICLRKLMFVLSQSPSGRPDPFVRYSAMLQALKQVERSCKYDAAQDIYRSPKEDKKKRQLFKKCAGAESTSRRLCDAMAWLTRMTSR